MSLIKATFGQIISMAKIEAIDTPSIYDSDSLWTRWLNEIELEVQQAFDWKIGEAIHTVTTAEGVNDLGEKPKAGEFSRWIRRRDNPYWIDGNGVVTEMEWIDSEAELRSLHGFNPSDKGKPTHLVEDSTNLYVYPLPDALNPSGAYSTSANYEIRVPYQRYEIPLSAIFPNNFFSDFGTKYLVFKLAARALLSNEDERWIEKEQLAEAELRRMRRNEKRSRRNNDKVLRPRDGLAVATQRWGR